MGATSFQVPNFMKAMLSMMTPEAKKVVNNLADLKYIQFENLSSFKRQSIIDEMNAVTNHGYTDMFRKNDLDNTRIISVKESGNILTEVILFNSKAQQTSAFYLQGRFDPDKIKALSTETEYTNFTNALMQSYQSNLTPSFNPNN
jgi:hypothetical protein